MLPARTSISESSDRVALGNHRRSDVQLEHRR